MRKVREERPATTFYKADYNIKAPLDYAAKDRKEIINSANPITKRRRLWNSLISWLNSPVRF